MKKIILILLVTLSFGAKAQTLNRMLYDSIQVGKTAGTSGISLYGKVYLKNVGLGLVSDSILTVVNGRIRKIPVSGVAPDSTVYRTVANSVSLAGLQTRLNTKENALTFSTGLTRSTNTITINQSFSPTWLGDHIFTQPTQIRGSGDDNHNILFNQLSGSNGVKQGIDFKDGNGIIRSGIKQVQTNFASGLTDLVFYNGFANAEAMRINSTQGVSMVGALTASNLSGTNTGDQNLAPYALLASPAFTGTPTAPTATAGTNTTQLATTAFVTNGIATAGAGYLPLTGGSLTGGLTITTSSPAITLNASTSNLNQIHYYYGGSIVGVAGYNPTGMVFGGETGIGTSIQSNGIARYTISSAGNHDFQAGTVNFGGAITGLKNTTSFENAVFKLQIGDGSADNRVLFRSNSDNTLAIGNGTSGSNGVFYIGATTGASPNLSFSNNGGTDVANINSTTGAYTATSDRDYKENILPSKDALPVVLGIGVKEYDWKNSSLHEPFGVIAQELFEVAPTYVSQPEKENGKWGVSKAEMVPMLIKAIQEQQAIITALEARIKALELK